ncbi:hypothetical protein PsorP6_006577 [Peronosclerospora sorghi]|uniref:Uncharacterized protein n=1 Tax=Peronosclerospora sorghi TaxID=230839 RepID=A0ACC0W3T5_9STRA|nr:hypothetical protein PsorP6_006577 [Peronosclerospora sorghi]
MRKPSLSQVQELRDKVREYEDEIQCIEKRYLTKNSAHIGSKSFDSKHVRDFEKLDENLANKQIGNEYEDLNLNDGKLLTYSGKTSL